MWPSFHIHLAVQALNEGKIISYPTESVFGLGCDPDDHQAIENLLHIKRRSVRKGLILIASDIRQLEHWVDFNKVPNMTPIVSSWPGHETWIVPAYSHISPLLTGTHEGLAVRVTNHPIVAELCEQFGGAITSTSANKNGQAEATSIFSVRQTFKEDVDFYLPGNTTGNLRPSRIRDARSGKTLRA